MHGVLKPDTGIEEPLMVFSSPIPGSRNHFHAVPVTMKESAIG
jgi:hypothetical protein